MSSGLDNLTIDIKKFINEEHESIELIVAIRIFTNWYINPNAMLKVFQCVQANKCGI